MNKNNKWIVIIVLTIVAGLCFGLIGFLLWDAKVNFENTDFDKAFGTVTITYVTSLTLILNWNGK